MGRVQKKEIIDTIMDIETQTDATLQTIKALKKRSCKTFRRKSGIAHGK